MANGLYTDVSSFRYRLGCVAELFLHRGKNRFLQKPSAVWLWKGAEEDNLQGVVSRACGALEGQAARLWSLTAEQYTKTQKMFGVV